MWWLCAASALLLSRPPPAAPCDGDLPNIQLDLPDEDVYTCTEDYIPLARQVLPSITSVYEQENSSHVCTAIVYTAAIPNSGAHRPTWAKYGEYIYCPPQQWVHNLKHGGVAFLYHPCVHPKLKKALSSLARRYIAKHVITPLHTLSRDRPIALAAWCSTLEISYINRTELLTWLRDNVYIERRYKAGEEGSYQHLLIRPSVMASADSSIYLRVVNYLAKTGSFLRRRRTVKRRRRLVLPVIPVVQERAVYNVSRSTASATPQNGEVPNNQTSSIFATANISSLSGHEMPGPQVYLPPEDEPKGSKADIHNRELDGNHKADMPELPANNHVPTAGDITHDLSGLNLSANAFQKESQNAADVEEQLPNSPDSKQSKVSVSNVLRPTPTPQTREKPADDPALPPERPSAGRKGQKQVCRCQQDTTMQLPVKAQRRLGVIQQKKSGVFVSTPRTEEAKWAAASLVFLFALLTFSVLYTQIYKKFRRSHSLYWTSESTTEEKESVASVIKRRLVQGHSIRKKWIGRKKSPVVLYESLSESSD